MNYRNEVLQQVEERRSFDPRYDQGASASSTAYFEATRTGRRSVNDDALRLVQQVFLQRVEAPARVVVFAGMQGDRGASQICASVAETLARDAQRTVCLVEAHLRSPAAFGGAGGTKGVGLTDALLRPGSIRTFCRPMNPAENLWLLPAGNLFRESPALLTSGALALRMEELRAEFDFVIIDTPSLDLCADAIPLGQLADGLVVVIEASVTRRDRTAAAVATLRNASVTILGAVLDRAS